MPPQSVLHAFLQVESGEKLKIMYPRRNFNFIVSMTTQMYRGKFSMNIGIGREK